jgi:predicted transposase YbfD/YdcC
MLPERCCLSKDVGWFDPAGQWTGLCAIARIEYERRRRGKPGEGDQVQVERRYFVTSLSRASIVLRCARLHWGIENSQHWRLDVFYREDDSRVRVGHAATNLAILRRLSLSIVKRDALEKVGVQTRRRMAGWDDGYRERLLATARVL